LYPIGFGHDSWTKKAWFQLRWSQENRRKEVILVIFGAFVGVVEELAIVYGCVTKWITIRDFLLEGNISTTN